MWGCRDGPPKATSLAREEAIVDVASSGIGIPLRPPDDLSAAEIERIVLKNVRLLVDPCRAAALKEGKSRYKAVMTVDAKGRASEWVTEPPFTSLERCVNGEMWRLTFPPTKNGGKAEIVISF